MNIGIMRTFVQLRQMLASNDELRLKLDKMEKRYNSQFRVVFTAIRELMKPETKEKRKIGFSTNDKVREMEKSYGDMV